MKILYCVSLVIVLMHQNAFTQDHLLTTLTIPDALKPNANAVIRHSKTEITLNALDDMSVKTTQIITVFNEAGDYTVHPYEYFDDDSSIRHLSLNIYNAYGQSIKKYPKSKFVESSAVNDFSIYQDDRVKYVNYTPSTYPYTAVFESTYRTSSTGYIPTWYPISTYDVAVEHSEYVIYNPNNFTIRTKEKHFENYPIQNVSNSTIRYVMKNQPAIKYESLSPPFIDIMPSLLVATDSFTLNRVKGNASNWKTFGKWMNDKLLAGRTQLNQSTIAKVNALVKGMDSDIEKAKVIYRYMQNKTRYISVQIGIGGWQPTTAKDVDNLGYGDCKGLTNYTKALLDAVGVPSYHVIVYAKNRRDIDSSFSKLQGNHMILNIPNAGNDIWLECTSQTLPFGFLGSFTDDRNVLVITPEGGVIKRTPKYTNDTNTQTTKAVINLDSTGTATADVEIVSKGIQYYNKYTVAGYSKKDLNRYYKTDVWGYLNNLEVNRIDITNDKDSIALKERLSMVVKDYATLNNDEFTFKTNIFNRNKYIPKRHRTRKLPFKIDRGYRDVDAFTFKIPEGYNLGVLPEAKNVSSKFGNYTLTLKRIDNSTFTYRKTFLLKEGTYTKEDYNDYRAFRKTIAKYENLALIFKRIKP